MHIYSQYGKKYKDICASADAEAIVELPSPGGKGQPSTLTLCPSSDVQPTPA